MNVTIEQCVASGCIPDGWLEWATEQNWPGGVVDMKALRARDLDWFRRVVRWVAGPELLTKLAFDAAQEVREAAKRRLEAVQA